MVIELSTTNFLNYTDDCMIPVESSNIQSIGILPVMVNRGSAKMETKEKAFLVNFKKHPEKYYIYRGATLTAELFDQWLHSESGGKFLNSTILPQVSQTYYTHIE